LLSPEDSKRILAYIADVVATLPAGSWEAAWSRLADKRAEAAAERRGDHLSRH
jgi:hypothetical protein